MDEIHPICVTFPKSTTQIPNWEVDEIHPRYQYMNFTDTLKGLL